MRGMRKSVLVAVAAAAATTLGALAPDAHAQQQWLGTEGNFNWDIDENWSPGPYPNAVGVIANINSDLVGDQTIAVPGSMPIVGVINLGDSGAAPDNKFTLGISGAGTLVFDNGASDAQLNHSKNITAGSINEEDVIGANLSLNSNLVVTVPDVAGDHLRINGNIADGANGPRGLIKNGTGWLELGQTGVGNTYTGTTVINGGRIRLASGGGFNLIVGDIEVNNGATIQDSNGNGNVIGDESILTFNNGYYNPGGASETVGGFAGVGAGTQDSQLGGGNGTIQFGAANAPHLIFEGRFGYGNNWIKIGTGIQEFGGTLGNWQSSGPKNFTVLAGAVYLNKTAGVSSVAQSLVNVGDGTLSGEERPELRLLQSQQIGVNGFDGTPAETSTMTLNSGIFNLNGNAETLGAMVVNGAGVSTIALGAGGDLQVVGNLTVDGGATAEVTGALNKAVVVNGTVAVPNGKLDLQDGKLITSTPAGTATGGTYDGVQGLVQAGHSAGTWAGSGIVTTEAGAATGLTSIGVGTGAQVLKLGAGATGTFGGQTVSDTSTIAMYTYRGDANMDGFISGDDYSAIDFASGTPGASGWVNGDFNYDGIISGDDYSAIDFNLVAQGDPFPTAGSAASGVTAVPEPAALSAISLAAASLLARRRRQRA